MDRRVEVAVEQTAGERARCVAGAVELELVHAVVAHEAKARLAEPLVVLGTGECEAALVRLEALRFAELQSLLLRLAVPAPRRHPDAGRRAVARRRGAHV